VFLIILISVKWFSKILWHIFCSKGFGHQPGQIAGDFGPGEIIVVKGLDGWNNERLSHLPGVCSIPHLSRRLLGMSGF